MATDAGNWMNDVARNGDVVYWNRSYDILRYRAGETTRLTAGDGVIWNSWTLTDGTNVIYSKGDPCCSNQNYRIAMHGAAGELILAEPRSQRPSPGRDYAVSGGWVAYTEVGSGGILQVWIRSPAGEQEQVTAFPSDSWIGSLGPSGDVVSLSGGRRYRRSPTAGAAPADIGSSLGRSLWLGDELLVIIGNTVFRVQ